MRSVIHQLAKRFLPNKIKQAIFKKKYQVLEHLIFAFHRMGWFQPIVWLWQFNMHELSINTTHNKAAILVFNSPGGIDDIQAAYQNNAAPYRFFVVDGELIKFSCKFFLGAGIEDYNGLLDAAPIAQREQYRAFLNQLIVALQEKLGLVGVINFNHVYHAQRDFALVSTQMGLPFVTLLKECLRTPKYNEETTFVYKQIIKTYEGTVIGVHNEMTQQILLDSGVVSTHQIHQVGQGRSCKLLRLRKALTEQPKSKTQKTILYFAISDTAGLPYFGNSFMPSQGGQITPFDWGNLSKQIWELLVQYVNQKQEVRLIVKGKPSGVYGAQALDAHNKNIQMIHGNPDMNLYREADVVIGFNTTALVEAVAVGVPALTPYLGFNEEAMQPYLFNWYGCVEIARSSSEFLQKLDFCLSSQSLPLRNQVDQLLANYLGNADGLAGDRIRQFFEQTFLSTQKA